jgi:hypothetical protein
VLVPGRMEEEAPLWAAAEHARFEAALRAHPKRDGAPLSSTDARTHARQGCFACAPIEIRAPVPERVLSHLPPGEKGAARWASIAAAVGGGRDALECRRYFAHVKARVLAKRHTPQEAAVVLSDAEKRRVGKYWKGREELDEQGGGQSRLAKWTEAPAAPQPAGRGGRAGGRGGGEGAGRGAGRGSGRGPRGAAAATAAEEESTPPARPMPQRAAANRWARLDEAGLDEGLLSFCLPHSRLDGESP